MSLIMAGKLFAQTSGLPGDHGRPFNGLPLPPNPPPPPAARPLPRGPSLELTLELARSAVGACAGFHVAVTVVDVSGTPKLFFVPDGTDGSHAYMALRKAYTALQFKVPTSKVEQMAKSDPEVAKRIIADSNLESFAGGVPILVHDELIGAVGVSGAEPSSKDEQCAMQGLARIQDRLRQ